MKEPDSTSPGCVSHRPSKRLSQNFLTDSRVASRMVEAFAPAATDHVLEVGPGRGVMTHRLAGRVARLVAVELDGRLVQRLAGELPEATIREDDILQIPLAELRGDGPPLRIIANLPYSISSPFLVKLGRERDQLSDALLMLQLEFADRIAAPPGNRTYGSISVAVQTSFDVTALFPVAAAAFSPRPRVQSRVVRLTPRLGEPLAEGLRHDLERLLRVAFSARRKMLGKALAVGLGLERATVDAELQRHGIDPRCRAETVDPDTWVALASSRLASRPS